MNSHILYSNTNHWLTMLQLFVCLLLFGRHCVFHTLLLNYLSLHPLIGFQVSLSTTPTKDSLSEHLVKYYLFISCKTIWPLPMLLSCIRNAARHRNREYFLHYWNISKEDLLYYFALSSLTLAFLRSPVMWMVPYFLRKREVLQK